MPSPTRRADGPRPRLRTRLRAGRVRPPHRARSGAPPGPALYTPRRGRFVLVVVLVALVCAAGIALYLNERSSREREQFAGPEVGSDYVTVEVIVQRVDPSALALTAKVIVSPEGALASPDNPLAPTAELVVETTSLDRALLRFPAGQRINAETIPFTLLTGRVSDYPFDRYQTLLGFEATFGGRPVPMVLSLVNADPFFLVRGRGGAAVTENAVVVTERLTRSRSTFILAWFMIVAMWALALSVLTAAWVIVTQRRGLVWPALGWMAATLFALVGMRNAAPGSPPIGSLLDYAAFFWAEAVIATALAVVVAQGARAERRTAAPPG
ncbi:DUF4436 family protein [Kitasatospora sp. NPDC093806]|uniref:DUF4436 family protein n=1 Tax=Kitasatospora sp. NPDC093806 TaxID=3155075 RepID=UPI0034173AE8